MVYLDGDNNLEEAALTDFNEMEAAETGAEIQVIVLFDLSRFYTRAQGDWSGTRLYEIRHASNPAAIASTRLVDTNVAGP